MTSAGGGDEAVLADTSVFIALEQHRPVSHRSAQISVSVITIGELRLGVLAAHDSPTRIRRLETLTAAMRLEPLPIDERVSHAWAALRVALRDAGRRMPINDSWIAATAIAHDMALVSQDAAYDDVPDLHVIRV